MEVKVKKAEHIVLSLNPSEASKLMRILCHSGAIWDDTCVKDLDKATTESCEEFSQSLYDELEDLEVKPFV